MQPIAALAEERRREYERAQPAFWRVSDDAVHEHSLFLATLVEDPSVVSLVARDDADRLLGYVFASVVPAPPVYRPDGPSGFIDDFAVASSTDWATVGMSLLTAARERLERMGAAQLVVVCGHHDEPKMAALLAAGLTRTSEWLVAPLDAGATDHA